MRHTNRVQLAFVVTNGAVYIQPRGWQQYLASVFNNAMELEGLATFQLVTGKTWKQLKFFHGPLLEWFCDSSGLPKTRTNKIWLKTHLKRQFVSEKRSLEDLALIAKFKGGEISEDDQWVDPSLRDFTKDEMIVFINNCMEYLAEFGLSLDRGQYEEYRQVVSENDAPMGHFDPRVATIGEDSYV